VLSIALGYLQNRARNTGHSDFVTATVRFTVTPATKSLSSMADALSDFTYGTFHAGALEAENRRLKAIEVAESLYNQRLSELNLEITSLRKLGSYPTYGSKTRVPTRVIGVFPGEYRVTLAAGSAEGVQPGDPVVAPDGLLGIVQTVDSHACQASLIWCPPPFKMGAIVARTPEAAGLMHGEAWNRLILDLDIHAIVQTGDAVMTSGFSEKIPRGIPIGRVVQVTEDKDFGTERVQVYPNVQLGEVQEVFILR
jgi:rod shape-determining protein MreC